MQGLRSLQPEVFPIAKRQLALPRNARPYTAFQADSGVVEYNFGESGCSFKYPPDAVGTAKAEVAQPVGRKQHWAGQFTLIDEWTDFEFDMFVSDQNQNLFSGSGLSSTIREFKVTGEFFSRDSVFFAIRGRYSIQFRGTTTGPAEAAQSAAALPLLIPGCLVQYAAQGP